MIRIVVRGPEEKPAERFAAQLADRLRETVQSGDTAFRVLGASAAPIAKVRGKFRFHILLQGPCGDALRAAVRMATSEVKTPDQLQWIVDVDPIDML